MARIATVCTDERRGTRLVDMSAIRWYRMSSALAELGHQVDVLHGRLKWRPIQRPRSLGPRLREVPLGRARWDEYDVVKTLFHRGFETLERFGGADHPFVVSKLGSVVDDHDRDGIYFFGAQREALYRVQRRIAETSRYVAVISEPARALWRELHGPAGTVLLVPGAADEVLPEAGADPFPDAARPRVVFAGNFYTGHRSSQDEAHRTIAGKLNAVGAALRARGGALYVVGAGGADSLDHGAVRYLGEVPYAASWDYLRHADVGLVVSAGAFMHNNESTKIYHYLRVGLPTVSESGFPNDHLVADTGPGRLVEPGHVDALVDAVVWAATALPDRGPAIDHILRHHTWRRRAETYDRLIREQMADSPREPLTKP